MLEQPTNPNLNSFFLFMYHKTIFKPYYKFGNEADVNILNFDLLSCRVASLCKDYCGVLNEETIRLNFVLVYELLDEVLVSLSHSLTPPHHHILTYTTHLLHLSLSPLTPTPLLSSPLTPTPLLSSPLTLFSPHSLPPSLPSPQDFGYPQGTSTETLKSYVCNQPCDITYEQKLSPLKQSQPGKTLPSHAANKPIATSLESMVWACPCDCHCTNHSLFPYPLTHIPFIP